MADEDIRVRIAGDLADIRKSLQDLRRDAKRAGDAAQQSSRGWRSLSQNFAIIQRTARALGPTLLSVFSVRAVLGFSRNIVEASDKVRLLKARLDALGAGGDAFAGLVALSQDAGIAIEDAADVFARFQIGGRAIGATDEELLRLTENLVKLGRIGGASTQQLTNGLIQLSQGFTLNRFAGQELRSVMENIPLVGQAIAKAMGQSATKIQAMGEAGEFTADAILQINKLSEEIDRDFEGLPRTFSQARTEIANEWTLLLAALDDDLKTSETFQFFSQGIKGFLRDVREGLGDLSTVSTEDLQSQVRAAHEELAALQEEREATLQAIEARKDRTLGERVAGIFTGQPGQDIADTRRLAQIGEAQRRARTAISRAEAELFQRRQSETDPEGPDTSEVVANARRRAAAAAEASAKVIKAETEAAQAALDEELKRNLVSFSDYYQRRAEIAQGQSDAEITAQREALAVVQSELSKANLKDKERENLLDKEQDILTEITVLEARRAEVGAAAARDLAEAERDLADNLEKVRARLLESQGQTAEARRTELEAEFRELIERLEAEGNVQGVAIIRRLIDVETAKARLSEIQAEFDRVTSAMSAQEQSIQTQVQTGVISEAEGRRRVNDLYAQTAERLRALLPLMQQMAAASGDPAAIARVEQLEASVRQLEETSDEVATTLRTTFRDAGEQAFASWIRGTESVGEAFRNLVDSMLDALARLAGQALFQSIFGGLPFFQAGVSHGGGVIGAGGASRMVPAYAFAGAPRMHGGGLAADERAAILQTGEEVLSRTDPRNVLNGGGAGEVNVPIVNNFNGTSDPGPLLTAIPLVADAVEKRVLRRLRGR